MLPRHRVVQDLLSLFEDPSYLEVGVFAGHTFFEVKAKVKVAVDPQFYFDPALKAEPGVTFHQVPSDDYFGSKVPEGQQFDVIFLDGLHTFEQTLRDFTNAIEILKPGGVILIDDILPSSYFASLPSAVAFKVRDFFGETHPAWMGDTYKLAFFIDTFFQQFSLCTVADNHGQLVVWRERRASVCERTVETVGGLPFDQLIVHIDVLDRRPMAEIMDHLRQWRSKAVAAPVDASAPS